MTEAQDISEKALEEAVVVNLIQYRQTQALMTDLVAEDRERKLLKSYAAAVRRGKRYMLRVKQVFIANMTGPKYAMCADALYTTKNRSPSRCVSSAMWERHFWWPKTTASILYRK